MPRPRKDLASLTIAAINDFERIRNLQKLVRMSWEQLADTSEETTERACLLLDAYLPAAECHLEELGLALERMRLMISGMCEENQEGDKGTGC